MFSNISLFFYLLIIDFFVDILFHITLKVYMNNDNNNTPVPNQVYVQHIPNTQNTQTIITKESYIKNFLMNIKGVKSVSGMGLMLGVETKKDAKQIASECLENGLLVLTAKTKIRLLPALNISYLELDRGLKILKEVIEK